MASELDAFLACIKPAILCHCEEDHDIIQRLNSFPKVHIKRDLTLFFQNRTLKEDFLKKSHGLKPGSAEHHRIIGLALGYPPMAADFFARSWIDQSLWNESVAFDYHGLYFAGHINDIQAIAEWLWSNVPAPPSSVKVTKINGETFFVHPKR
jgi:hypothetical protein